MMLMLMILVEQCQMEIVSLPVGRRYHLLNHETSNCIEKDIIIDDDRLRRRFGVGEENSDEERNLYPPGDHEFRHILIH